MKDLENALSELKSGLEDNLNDQLKDIKDHVNKLDVKMKTSNNGYQSKDIDPLANLIETNFKQVSQVSKGTAVRIENKAVGDMSLTASLTGDQPRSYNSNVVKFPSQLVNVSDLVQSISISGGTYTFPKETGSEGGIAAHTEGTSKSQIDYDIQMVDVTTEFIAGFCRYSRKMRNNLPYLTSFLPEALRRDYWKKENEIFYSEIESQATASTEVITGQNKVEMLMADIGKLEDANYNVNRIVVRPSDWYDILVSEKSTGAGYGLPVSVQLVGSDLYLNGIHVVKATWVPQNKYILGDWTRIKKVVTEGLSVDFSEEDGDNFVKNAITARVESQVALAIERPEAVVIGDFSAA